jgi:hypothetical protein
MYKSIVVEHCLAGNQNLFLTLTMSEPQLQETYAFYPSPASVTTPNSPVDYRVSKGFVRVHRDGIPPTVLASFSCRTLVVSVPVTVSISASFPTAWS